MVGTRGKIKEHEGEMRGERKSYRGRSNGRKEEEKGGGRSGVKK